MTTLGWGSFAAVAMVAAVGVVQGMAGHGSPSTTSAATRGPAPRPSAAARPAEAAAASGRSAAATGIPGLGAAFGRRVPADTSQVVLASGRGRNDDRATVTLYTRGADGRWHAGASWPAHNALRGWTPEHHLDDLRSPIGVYSLTNAGGLDPDPGARLPYVHSSEFTAVGTGFEGESLAGAFDYVVAINYNHVPGSSPLDERRPLGAGRGGGIWLHVDHGGPTHGCVSIPKTAMAALLRWLDPADHPVIVMGDAKTLASS